MSDKNVKTTQEEAGCCLATEPGSADGAGCCGETMQSCCQALKRHRLAVLTVISAIVLAVLVSQVGGVLGIIGFFRTF